MGGQALKESLSPWGMGVILSHYLLEFFNLLVGGHKDTKLLTDYRQD